MNAHCTLDSDPRGGAMFTHNQLRVLTRLAALLVLLAPPALSPIQAQSQFSAHTLKLGEKGVSPPASIADVAWIAGSWRGPAFGGICDEIWSPPEGNNMVGMFRLVKDGKTVFYELMTIVEENNSLVMKLKHFNSSLNGWEEKDVSQNFPIVKIGLTEAFFSGLTYRKLTDGSLQIFVAMKEKSGELAEEEFRLRPPTSNEVKAKIEEKSLIRTHALKINVDDMQKALLFYVEKLGFEIQDKSAYPQTVILKTNDRIKLILNRVERLQKAGPKDTQVGLTLQVNDLDQSIARLKSQGVQFAEPEPRKEAVGNAITILDPFGRRISLMHQTVGKVESFKEPRIYNFGLLIPDMNMGRTFYANGLGFVVRSEKYLPLDLPLGHKDKSFGFMLHYRYGVQAFKTGYSEAAPYYTIVFETDNMKEALEAMNRNGIEIIRQEPPKAGKPGTVVFTDPFGNISELEGVGIMTAEQTQVPNQNPAIPKAWLPSGRVEMRGDNSARTLRTRRTGIRYDSL